MIVFNYAWQHVQDDLLTDSSTREDDKLEEIVRQLLYHKMNELDITRMVRLIPDEDWSAPGFHGKGLRHNDEDNLEACEMVFTHVWAKRPLPYRTLHDLTALGDAVRHPSLTVRCQFNDKYTSIRSSRQEPSHRHRAPCQHHRTNFET